MKILMDQFRLIIRESVAEDAKSSGTMENWGGVVGIGGKFLYDEAGRVFRSLRKLGALGVCGNEFRSVRLLYADLFDRQVCRVAG